MPFGEAARKALEAMDLDKYEFQSTFAKRFLAQGRSEGRAEGRVEGRAEGRVEGRAEGEAQALLQILQARDIPVDEQQRAQILSCTDIEQLNAWIRRALQVTSVAELFEP